MIPQQIRNRIQRFQGVMAGLALGDAVGAPYEGFTRATIRRRFAMVTGPAGNDPAQSLISRVRRGERAKKVVKSADSVHPPGLYNSAAQQALIAAERILAEGSTDPASFASACVRFMFPTRKGKFGVHRKPSVAFKAAINRFAAGETVRDCADEPAIIECAFRCIPSGLVLVEDLGAAAKAAAVLAALTDRSPEGVSCAAATALLCGLLSREPSPPSFADAASMLCQALESALPGMEEALGPDGPAASAGVGMLRDFLRFLVPWMPGSDEPGADDTIASAVSSEIQKFGHELRDSGSGFAPSAFATAMAIALTEPAGPGRAILRAVNLGGRTSWVAGLTGAFSGAMHGKDSLPADWLKLLWNRSAVLRLAELLARPEERRAWPGNLYEIEMEANEEAGRFRARLKAAVLAAPGFSASHNIPSEPPPNKPGFAGL